MGKFYTVFNSWNTQISMQMEGCFCIRYHKYTSTICSVPNKANSFMFQLTRTEKVWDEIYLHMKFNYNNYNSVKKQ